MTCRTYSDCANRPDRKRPSSTPAASGKKKVGPLAGAVLLHAAVIASFVVPALGTKPAEASLQSLTVALVAEQAAEKQDAEKQAAKTMPAKSETRASPASAKPVPAHQQADPHSALIASDAVQAHAIDASAAGSGVPASASAGAAVGHRTNASIPAHYAAGNRKPDYPLLARRLEEQGTVILRVLVREDGRAGKVVVRQSSGHELLDESARAAVEKWRFQPASVDNVAIAEWYQVAIPFTLYN